MRVTLQTVVQNVKNYVVYYENIGGNYYDILSLKVIANFCEKVEPPLQSATGMYLFIKSELTFLSRKLTVLTVALIAAKMAKIKAGLELDFNFLNKYSHIIF